MLYCVPAEHTTLAWDIFLVVFSGSGAWRYKAGAEMVIGAVGVWVQKEEEMGHERPQVKVDRKIRRLARG